MRHHSGEANSAFMRTLTLSSPSDLAGFAESVRTWSSENVRRIVVQLTWGAAENRYFLADALETLVALRRQLAAAGITLAIEFIDDEVRHKHHGFDVQVAGAISPKYARVDAQEPAPEAASSNEAPRTTEVKEPPAESRIVALPEASKPARTMEQRNVSVRYFSQMNPGKVFPLLVVVSHDRIKHVSNSRIAEAQAASLEMDARTSLWIEPIVPGCTCYPAKTEIRLDRPVIEEAFWLVPEVSGVVEGAQVELRQNGKLIDSLPLNIRVRSKAWVWIWALCSGIVPILSDLLSLLDPSLSSTSRGASASVLSVLAEIGRTIPPIAFFAFFATLSAAIALLVRPKQEQSFWDIAGIET